MKLSQTRVVIALAILVVSTSGCGLVNRVRAKNQLNEAARAYHDGHFEEEEPSSLIQTARPHRYSSPAPFTRNTNPVFKLRKT